MQATVPFALAIDDVTAQFVQGCPATAVNSCFLKPVSDERKPPGGVPVGYGRISNWRLSGITTITRSEARSQIQETNGTLASVKRKKSYRILLPPSAKVACIFCAELPVSSPARR